MSHEHYYTEQPTSKLLLFKLTSVVRGFNLEFLTATGVFSYQRVNKASKLLAEKMIVMPGQSVLDLGCGYGVVGIVAAKLGCDATLVDINERALMLARKNVKLNRVKARVLKSNLFSNVDESFDVIVSNPPIAMGISFNYRLITESAAHLMPGGTLQIVARHNKGGSRLKERMIEVFGNCCDLVKSGGYRVYYSEKI